jgi:carbamoyltransferase
MDLARSIQLVCEEIILRMAKTVHRDTGARDLCMAGGVALNAVANGRLLREGPFDRIWIQPAAGDAGGALGVALLVWHRYFEKPRVTQHSATANELPDGMCGAYLGPVYSAAEIESALRDAGAVYQRLGENEVVERVADLLASEQVVGWFDGRMEFGPRALGARSILADPRSPRMQALINLKIKFREGFRPFAPSVLRESAHEYFDLKIESPYMLIVAPVVEARRKPAVHTEGELWGIDLLNVPRSDIPAVTHLDYSARIQTVTADRSPRYYKLISEFNRRTGCPLVVNTSFNVRGEPIVCTPADAYRCFMRTHLDYLAIGPFLLAKSDQPASPMDETWKKQIPLD